YHQMQIRRAALQSRLVRRTEGLPILSMGICTIGAQRWARKHRRVHVTRVLAGLHLISQNLCAQQDGDYRREVLQVNSRRYMMHKVVPPRVSMVGCRSM